MSTLTPRLDRYEQNIIINGNFDFWQRGSSFTGITANALYQADRFNLTRGAAITGLVNTIAQSSDVPTVAQSGFKSTLSWMLTNTSPATNMLTSANIVGPTYHIEGYDLTRIVGRTINLSFWVKSSVAGTYSMAFVRQFTDSYITTYTISAANTWERKSINVLIDSSVNWGSNSGLVNGRGLILIWTLGAGTANTTSTLNSWLIGSNFGNANTATNTFASTNGATFQLSQVMVCDSAFSPTVFTRHSPSIQGEYAACERYFKTIRSGIAIGQSTTAVDINITHNPPMRTSPSYTVSGALQISDVVAADFTQSSGTAAQLNAGTWGGRIRLGNFTGLTTNRPYQLEGDDVGQSIFVDAEL